MMFERARSSQLLGKAMAGSLYVMQDEARWRWLHQLWPVKELRYSFTFRRLRDAG